MAQTTLRDSTNGDDRIAVRCICCCGDYLERSPAVLMPFIAFRAFGWTPVEVTPEWGLRDIKAGMAYPLCNSVQCQQCGALFLDIRFSDSEMSRIYAGYRGDEYTEARERFEPGYRARAAIIRQGAAHTDIVENFLRPHLPARPRILDWGGDTGGNTPFRSSCDLHHIFDISDTAPVDGATRVSSAGACNTQYDLVVLAHVLEHVPQPAALISEISKFLTTDSILYIETPYEDLVRLDPGSRLLHADKKYWHEHINFFTLASLEALLGRCGLDVVDRSILETEGGGKHWHVFAIACRLTPDRADSDHAAEARRG